MAMVTRQELIDAAADCATLEQVVNGAASPGTLTSRLGTSLRTVLKVIADVEAEINTAGDGWLALAEDWASKVDGIVDTTDYSAKAWSIGGTGVTATSGKGAAKEWATKTSAAVDTSEFSAKEYAQGSQASTGGSAKSWAQQTGADVTGASVNSRSAKSWAQDNLAGATHGGSAKDWAQSSSLPDGTNKSAKSYAEDAAASAALVAVQELVPTIETDGLDLTIGAFSVRDKYGAAYTFAETTKTMRANETQYVVMDLGTGDLQSLKRAAHHGCIPICKVVTGASSITTVTRLFSHELVRSRISNTLAKIRTSRTTGDVRIALMGDSMTEGGGGTPRWKDLLFDSANVAYGYNITNLANITTSVYAKGSSSSNYGLMWIGEGCKVGNGGAAGTGFAYGPAEATRRFNPPTPDCGISPLIQTPFDLVIIGYGTNTATYDEEFLETTIRHLRAAGSEVLLISQAPNGGDNTFLEGSFPSWIKMADALGCAFADTWAYTLELDLGGTEPYSDGIHLTAAGHEEWAKAVKSVLDPLFEPHALHQPLPLVRTVRHLGGSSTPESDANNWRSFPNHVQVAFTPDSTTGTANDTCSISSALSNPAIAYGGKTSSNACTTLTAGQSCDFAHHWWSGCELIVDGASAYTATLIHNGGASTIGTSSLSTTVSGRPFVREGAKVGCFGSTIRGQWNRLSTDLRITCDTGTLKLIGVIFHTDKTYEMDHVNTPKFTGTWSTETGTLGAPVNKYTDTDGDYFDFEFEGSTALLLLGSTNSAGIVDIYRNGEKIYDQYDLYAASGTRIYGLPITAGSVTNYNHYPKSKNYVKVVLNGLNGSASAAATNKRRLGVHGIKILERF